MSRFDNWRDLTLQALASKRKKKLGTILFLLLLFILVLICMCIDWFCTTI